KLDLTPGSDNVAALTAAALMFQRASVPVLRQAQARDPRTAFGDDLDELLFLRGTKRKSAARSAGVVYLQRSAGPAPPSPAGWRVGAPAADNQPAVELAFNDTTSVLSSTLKVALNVTATNEGSAGNVQLAAVTGILDPLPDPSWTLFVPSGG